MSDTRLTHIVIFGASGDLTARKLIPALFTLWRKKRLPEQWQVTGFSFSDLGDEEFRRRMHEGVRTFTDASVSDAEWDLFANRLHYISGDFTEPADYERLQVHLKALSDEPTNRLYYLATPPRFFSDIIGHLGSLGMTYEQDGWRRVVVEKPFGRDLASARALNHSIHGILNENQVYRIDHYLAKETVQNLLVFRFGNAIFEPIWNRNFIDRIQITAAESVDVGHRAGYYEQSGVLRDMFQNHLLQLLSLVSMEPPASFEADAIRNEKVKVLSSIRPLTPAYVAANTVRGQYTGYREAPKVVPGSTTPTYAALRLFIENWRWQGVPFYLRSGKALPEKKTEILIHFKRPPHMMFPIPDGKAITPNILAICIQPQEAIRLRFEAKVPDTDAEMRSVNMTFTYDESFGVGALPEAYERLLLEALEGDASLFTRADAIELAWDIIDRILEGWASDVAPPLHFYETGTWGPDAAEALITEEGGAWL